ncbi:MAG: glycosyltransferase family 2 protein, partial [Lachnospiraceae bacterium]|nr:glycosyltransferase family 2 protein [Lachnospiraceae bacterium]
MNNDLVTIVVPAYNAEPFLRENIESVIRQSYWNLEIIYVCDGCTDHTVKILQEYAGKDARIKVVVERENHGAAVSRNIGMDMASGEWIIFWDSDDIFHVQTIETMVKTAIRESADVVCCYWECFEDAPKGNAQIENAMRKLYCDTYPVVDTDKELYQIMQLIDNSPCTKLVHKSIYRKREIFFQDIPNANDVYYAMVIAINSHKIVYADKPFLYIRMNKNRSTISTDRDLKRSYILEAMDKIYEYIMSREDSALLLKSFYNNVIYNM